RVGFDDDGLRLYRHDAGREEQANLSCSYGLFKRPAHPRLNGRSLRAFDEIETRSAQRVRNARTGFGEIESRFGGRVSSADHKHTVSEKRRGCEKKKRAARGSPAGTVEPIDPPHPPDRHKHCTRSITISVGEYFERSAGQNLFDRLVCVNPQLLLLFG